MKCVQSWSLIWKKKKKKWYTWIVGHLLNRKNNSTKSPKITRKDPAVLNAFQLHMETYNCRWLTNTEPRIVETERSAVQIPTFAKWYTYIGTLGFIFIFCSLVIYWCLSTCKNNPHMFHFKLFALFWYCNTSNGAQRTRGGRGTLESSTQRLSAHYGKGVYRNSLLHSFSWAQLVLHEKME